MLTRAVPGRTTSPYAARAAATHANGPSGGRAPACREAARDRIDGFAEVEVRAYATRVRHVAREIRAMTSP